MTRAGIGRDGAGHDAEQGGLARPVGTDDAERLAGRQREVDRIGDHDGAEPLRDFIQRQGRGHGLSSQQTATSS